MTVTVLGIAGGTRRGGNSETLLDRALDGAREAGAAVEKTGLLGLDFSGGCVCPHSEDCLPTGICTVLDDMQALYVKLRSVDLVYLAFPVAFRGVPAQTKAMFDRTQALWAMKYRLKRQVREASGTGKGLIIATADRSDPHEFDGAIQATRSWLVSFHFREAARLLYSGLVRQTDVLQRPAALQEAYETGKRLAAEALTEASQR